MLHAIWREATRGIQVGQYRQIALAELLPE